MIKTNEVSSINFAEIKNLEQLAAAFKITKSELDKRFTYAETNNLGNTDIQIETLSTDNKDDFVTVEIVFDKDNNFVSAKLVTILEELTANKFWNMLTEENQCLAEKLLKDYNGSARTVGKIFEMYEEGAFEAGITINNYFNEYVQAFKGDLLEEESKKELKEIEEYEYKR